MSVADPIQQLKSSLYSTRFLALTLLRSLSQIFFVSHPLPGLFFLVALVSYDWKMATLILFSVTIAVGTATLASMPNSVIRSGAHGFCAALVSAAVYVRLGPSWLAILLSFFGAVASVLLTAVLIRIFSASPLNQFRLPYLTAPFCTVAGIALVFTADTASVPMAPAEQVAPVLFQAADVVFSSISQVLLVDDVLVGVLILTGLFLVQWKVGTAALLGATLGPASAYFLGTPHFVILQGLAGYNAVLVSIALATVFIAGTWQPWVWAMAGLLLLIPVTGAINALPIPGYTWPFICTTWLMLILATLIPGLRKKP